MGFFGRLFQIIGYLRRRSDKVRFFSAKWKRAHKNSRILFFILVLLSLFTLGQLYHGQMTRSIDGDGAYNSLSLKVVHWLKPIIAPINKVSSFIGNLPTYFKGIFTGYQDRHQALENQNKLEKAEQKIKLLTLENLYLRKLNHIPNLEDSFIRAPIIMIPSSPLSRGLYIASGTKDGVERGMAAIKHNNIIGRVSKVTESTAKVTLISDESVYLPAQIGLYGQRLLLKGNGESAMVIAHFEGEELTIKDSDIIYTTLHVNQHPMIIGVAKSSNAKKWQVVPQVNMHKEHFIDLITLPMVALEGELENL